LRSKKPKRKRGDVAHPNLYTDYNPRIRHDLLDFDYLSELSEEELDFLNKFAGEYIHGVFPKEDGDYSSENFVQDEETRRTIWRDNNKKRKCVMAVGAIMQNTVSLTHIPDFKDQPQDLVQDEGTVEAIANASILVNKAQRLDAQVRAKIKKFKK
jgi:hypothetical protein